jgi:hypothetical protein
MIEVIGSMVHGGSRTLTPLFWHCAGGAAGGAMTGLAAGSVGTGLAALPFVYRGEMIYPLAVVAAVCLGHTLTRTAGSFGLKRQTPRAWGALPRPLMMFLYGADLGLGWSTRIYFASFIAVFAAAAATADPLAGASIGAIFGLSRAVFAAFLATNRSDPLFIDSIVARRKTMGRVDAMALLQFMVVTVALGVGIST